MTAENPNAGTGWQVEEAPPFRRWRRSRPFWGGLLTVLAGLEVFASSQLSLAGLTMHLGPTGFLSWLIPTLLVACGALMIFTPDQRMFYAIIAAVVSIYSLIGVNLGGFFLGLILGLVGAALGFAWTPTKPEIIVADVDPATPDDGGTAAADAPPIWQQGHVEQAPGQSGQPGPGWQPGQAEQASWQQPRTDAYAGYPAAAPYQTPRIPAQRPPAEPPRHTPWQGQHRDAPAGPDQEGELPDGRTARHAPRALSIALILAMVSAVGVVIVRVTPPAGAAENCTSTSTSGSATKATPKPSATAATGTGTTTPSTGSTSGDGKTATPTATPSTTPTPTPTASADAGSTSGDSVGQAITNAWNGFVDGVSKLFGGGDSASSDDTTGSASSDSAASATPSASSSAKASTSSKKKTKKAKTASAGATATAQATKTAKAGTKPWIFGCPSAGSSSSLVSTLAATSGLIVQPGTGVLTGSKVTMYSLTMHGVTTLNTKDGAKKVLWFSMAQSDTDDFKLVVDGGTTGHTMSYEADVMTVKDSVDFYATSFSGKILGIPITYTVDAPGIPIWLPIAIIDQPRADIVFISCGELSVKNNLTVSMN